ncbi:MAG TPA: hypothetical protein VFE27_16240 [Acidobacteriaceae bacterium]|jgi:hypothetical protein|nr:hypothetical protein [Acidobacteriaceae bacterium]
MTTQKTPLIIEDPWISPRYRASHWRIALNTTDWAEMTTIFRDRLVGRFLGSIHLIANDEEIGRFAGFSTLALDCLLIETLNQFYKGLDETPSPHVDEFREFFLNSEHFRDHFSDETAKIFYWHIRCGLLHQAQTKKKSFIRADDSAMITVTTNDVRDGIIVNRVKFHEAVERVIESYIKRLLDGGVANDALRTNFIVKMKLICGDPL